MTTESEPMLLADGLEHAFLGLACIGNRLEPVACYDYDAVIQGFVAEGMTVYLQRMTIEQAIEIAESE